MQDHSGMHAGAPGGMPTGDGQHFQNSEIDSTSHMQQMKQQLRLFWMEQQAEMERLEVGSEQDFKNHNDLPLARIKRIMKSDEDVRMISAEAPVLFAKACEMFILELTLRCVVAHLLNLARKSSGSRQSWTNVGLCVLASRSYRSWCYSEKNKRRTLQKEDIQTAIKKTEIFDFLVDVIN